MVSSLVFAVNSKVTFPRMLRRKTQFGKEIGPGVSVVVAHAVNIPYTALLLITWRFRRISAQSHTS